MRSRPSGFYFYFVKADDGSVQSQPRTWIAPLGPDGVNPLAYDLVDCLHAKAKRSSGDNQRRPATVRLRGAASAAVGTRWPASQQGGDGHQSAPFADRRARRSQRAPQPSPEPIRGTVPAEDEPGVGCPRNLRPGPRAQPSLAIAARWRVKGQCLERQLPQPAGRGIGRSGRFGCRSKAGGCRVGLYAVAVGSIAES